MHVVFVTNELATAKNTSGGLASFTANIARIFAAHGHKVTLIFASTKDVNCEFDSDIDLKYFYVTQKRWDYYDGLAKILAVCTGEQQAEMRKVLVSKYKGRRIQSILREINKTEKIDLVHYCNHGFYSTNHCLKVPYVIRISGYLNIWNGGANTRSDSILFQDNPVSLYQRMDHQALQKAKYVIVPSELLAQIGRENLGIYPMVLESPFVLTRNDWDDTIYREKLDNKKYVIFYGSMKYLKGIHVIGDLVKEFLAKYPDMYFVLSGQDTKLERKKGSIWASEYIKECAGVYSDRVVYVGRLVREQLYPIIQNSQLCVLPSRIENLSNACIEAMAMGKIVVGTQGASFEQLIENGVNGFLCTRDDSKSFMQGIEKALSMSEEEKLQMVQKAEMVVERLTPENVYKNYYSYYKKILEG